MVINILISKPTPLFDCLTLDSGITVDRSPDKKRKGEIPWEK